MGFCGAQNIAQRPDIATLAQHFTVHLGWDYLFGLMMEHGGVLENFFNFIWCHSGLKKDVSSAVGGLISF